MPQYWKFTFVMPEPKKKHKINYELLCWQKTYRLKIKNKINSRDSVIFKEVIIYLNPKEGKHKK